MTQACGSRAETQLPRVWATLEFFVGQSQSRPKATSMRHQSHLKALVITHIFHMVVAIILMVCRKIPRQSKILGTIAA